VTNDPRLPIQQAVTTQAMELFYFGTHFRMKVLGSHPRSRKIITIGFDERPVFNDGHGANDWSVIRCGPVPPDPAGCPQLSARRNTCEHSHPDPGL